MIYANHLKSTALVVTFLVGSIPMVGASQKEVLSFKGTQPEQAISTCDEIEVKLDITQTTEGKQNGKIVMNFEKSNISYTSFVFSGDSENNRLEVKDNEISDLGKGEYNLYIQDKNGCTKHVKFKIN